MANKTDSTELDVARRARLTAREKMAHHIGSPNLNRSGTQKRAVAPTSQGRPTSAASLKREYGNGREKSVQEVEREVVGDSITMRGKARAMIAAQGNVAQRKQALKLSPNFTVPMTSDLRPANKEGATSFHFKHDTIAKTRHEKALASGTKTRKNAGRDHSKYLERDSAVARNGEAIESASLSSEKKEIANSLGRAAAGGLYIEREEALAYQENGVAVIYSNISSDAKERHQFWAVVEEHEPEPKPDHLKFVTGGDPDFWEAVRTDLRCPKQLSLAIQEADPSKSYRVQTDDNEFIRQIMTDHGWAPPSPHKSKESAGEKAERELIDKDNSKGAHCVDGRGGRIQSRIVGELPHEVSHEQRVRILLRFAAHFEDRNLPYVAVMHAPDHANHERNWHFHLAYYERPCRRFTGEPDDYLTEPEANWRAEARHAVKLEAFASGALNAYVGKEWDFAVPVSHTTKCGHKRTTYPLFQDKDRECTKRDYPLKLRKMLAEFTNDELELAGSGRRVDPRRFSEMGINKTAEKHLGTRSAQMESVGLATPQGVENEHRQWQFMLDRIHEKLQSDDRKAANKERLWRQSLESRALDADDHSDVSRMVTYWAQIQAEADEQTAIASELKLHIDRARSRAEKVQLTCKRHLEAIGRGQASKRQAGDKADYEARMTEANDHLSGLKIVMASEIVQEKRSRNEAGRLTDEANKLRAAIDARLKDALATMMAAMVLAKGRQATEPAPANDKAPVASNDESRVEAVFNSSRSEHSLYQYEVERFMMNLVDNNRRLENVGMYIVPVNPTEEEKHIITACNYADHHHRLFRLKTAQDELINRLARHILHHPGAIKNIPSKAGAGDSRYELLSTDGTLQRTFKGFADDDLIKTAIKTALEARQNDKNGVVLSAPANSAGRPSGRSQVAVRSPATEPFAASPGESKGGAASLTQFMRKIADIAAAATPVLCEIRNGKPVFRLAQQDMIALGLFEGDLDIVPVQTRLRGIHRQQEGDINRLVGFIRRSPARAITSPRLISSNDQAVVGLARNAPSDLRALAIKYAQHPSAQKQMTNALRLATLELTTEQRKAEPKPAPKNDGAPTVQRRGGDPAHPGATLANAVRSAGIDVSFSIKVRPEWAGHEPASNDKNGKTADSDLHFELPVPRETVFERPNEKKSVTEKLAPPAPGPGATRAPLVSTEERADILAPRTFGMTSGSEPAQVAAKVEEATQVGENPSGIRRGAHPKIDAWIEALDSQDREGRQIAALALKNDRKALRVAFIELDRETQARIRMDWEAQVARNWDTSLSEYTEAAERRLLR
jgi:MobA/MobL family